MNSTAPTTPSSFSSNDQFICTSVCIPDDQSLILIDQPFISSSSKVTKRSVNCNKSSYTFSITGSFKRFVNRIKSQKSTSPVWKLNMIPGYWPFQSIGHNGQNQTATTNLQLKASLNISFIKVVFFCIQYFS